MGVPGPPLGSRGGGTKLTLVLGYHLLLAQSREKGVYTGIGAVEDFLHLGFPTLATLVTSEACSNSLGRLRFIEGVQWGPNSRYGQLKPLCP